MAVKLAYLRDFTAVAEAGSIRAAARKLGLSQASLTKSIQQLEKELDAPLFIRQTHGVCLTPMGRAYLLRAQTAVQELRKGEEEVAQLRGQTGGSLSFGVSAVPALTLLPEVLPSFKRKYPGCRVRLVSGGFSIAFPLLRDGLLDFTLSPRPQQKLGDEYVFEDLFRCECVVVGRKGHPLAHARSLAELVEAEWLVAGATDLDSSTHYRAFEDHGLVAPENMTRCEYVPAFMSLVPSTDMLMILPSIWAHGPVGAGTLVVIPVRESLPAANIGVIRRKGLVPTPAAEYMLTLVRRWAARHPTIGQDGLQPSGLNPPSSPSCAPVHRSARSQRA